MSFDSIGSREGVWEHNVIVYLAFSGRLAFFAMMYQKGDPKAKAYERDLLAMVRSFGPLYGPSAPDGECSKAAR